jgi:hypothetical protein
MAEHMQAVKTTWKLFFKSCSGEPRMILVEDQNDIPVVLSNIKTKGCNTVKMIETRTCDAMPGMVYTKENVIDLDLLFS